MGMYSVFYVVYLVAFSLTTLYGEGRHIIFVTDPRMLQIYTIITEVAYYFCIGFIKFSILRLYGAIFTSRPFYLCLWAVAAFVAGWLISSAIVSIFQCTPIQYAWNPTIDGGFCINYGLLVLIAGVFNIVTDFTILGMPIPMILRLQISRQKKYLLIFTFAMGSSACVVSMVRVAYSLMVGSTANGSWDNVAPGFVSSAELLIVILAASIPTYRPLYRRFVQQNHGYKSQGSSRTVKVSVGRIVVPNSDVSVHITDQVELIRHANRNGKWVRVADEEEPPVVDRSDAGRSPLS
ncbi:hypothetical protein DL767_008294 [Monosporascus sp. MG133]|nr:hypothetical protein DL767_008294 [Monosporascus sp. MG133]